jgi:hypothetical protein
VRDKDTQALLPHRITDFATKLKLSGRLTSYLSSQKDGNARSFSKGNFFCLALNVSECIHCIKHWSGRKERCVVEIHHHVVEMTTRDTQSQS